MASNDGQVLDGQMSNFRETSKRVHLLYYHLNGRMIDKFPWALNDKVGKVRQTLKHFRLNEAPSRWNIISFSQKSEKEINDIIHIIFTELISELTKLENLVKVEQYDIALWIRWNYQVWFYKTPPPPPPPYNRELCFQSNNQMYSNKYSLSLFLSKTTGLVEC